MQKIKTKNGIKYRVELKDKSGKKISARFKRLTDAKKWEARTRLEIENREATGKEKRRILYKYFVKEWLEEKVKYQCSPGTYSRYKDTVRLKLNPLFGKIYLDKIEISHGDKLILNLRQKNHVASGINMILTVFKTSLNEAVRLGHLDKSPLFGMKKLKTLPKRDIFWTEGEISQFLRANITTFDYPVYVLALNTGMRRGELAGLMWDRVNFKRNVIEVTRTRDRFGLRDTTKSSRKRMIPLNPESRQVLQKLFKQQLNNRFCLCEPNGNPINFHHLGRRLAKATKKAGIENIIHFHALRHTFASHFMMRGGNIYDLQKILGHSKLEMTERYSHLAPEHLEKAISIISFSGNLDATQTPEELIEENNVMSIC